ncbi:ABC transporter substrate-binding protein [Mycolicibacterium sp.]|uniref:ABC transporter substrate-binding protein n=1 Tax=Mycolicibacterium sp. TaxID=2320850 RepID=UPI0025ECF35C|nr:ABC transporter substrate-binding protein [Mycolicibacterium sp.]
MLTSRHILPIVLASTLLGGCSSSTPSEKASSPAGNSASTSATSCGTTVDQIAAAAKKEGNVNLIALPDNWANYAGILKSFRDTYGFEASVANPDASSADELTAIKTLAGQPSKPDSIDIGPSFVSQAMAEKLIEPYLSTNWAEIPSNLKDPDGNWVGSYYGIMSIATNTKLVPSPPMTWADLKKPDYKGMVTINGDPREAEAAVGAVVAAALANGGSYDDIMPGIMYFAELKKSGNLQTMDVTPAALLSGDVPIALDWSYNFPAIKKQMQDAGFTVAVTIPTDGLYGSYYSQSVVSDPVHPCAARLWIEHITGNDGALGYLAGGAIPARYAALEKAGLISDELRKDLPSAEQISKINFPTADQINMWKKVITENWGPMVADA